MEALEPRIVLSSAAPALLELGPPGVAGITASAGDQHGNYYLVGSFNGKVDFNPRTSRSHFLVSDGTGSMFLGRYSAAGEPYWVISLRYPAPNNGYPLPYSIATDGRGDVYMIGAFKGSPTRDPATGELTLTQDAENGPASTIWKFRRDGTFSFANHVESIAHEHVTGTHIAVDQFGSIYTTEVRTQYADDPARPTVQSLLTKLRSNSQPVWSKPLADNYPSAMAVDRDGNPWVAITHLHFSDPDIEVAMKYNGRGRFGDSTAIASGYGNFSVEAMTFDDEDDLITAGAFSGTWDFDPGAGERLLGPKESGNGYVNAFVSKIGPDHGLVFANVLGGEFQDAAEGVTVDRSGRITVVGMFDGTVDFDPSAGGTYLLKATTTGATFNQSLFCATYDHAGRFLSASSESKLATSVDILPVILAPGRVMVPANTNHKAVLWLVPLAR